MSAIHFVVKILFTCVIACVMSSSLEGWIMTAIRVVLYDIKLTK